MRRFLGWCCWAITGLFVLTAFFFLGCASAFVLLGEHIEGEPW